MNTPILNALKRYGKKHFERFHMPGHKGKDILFGGTGHELVALDVTELPETDNLAAPEGILREAQKLAAKACGASETLFLTGGSTLGNLAMIYGLCCGEKVIVDRFCHVSVFNALAVSRANPVYVENEIIDPCGILGAVSPEAVKKTIKENTDAKAVFITSPNAFGICADLRGIAELCRENNMLLLVDEAHGAHFAFSENLPDTAIACGADACVQSFHKTLPALTQAAVLHISNPDISKKVTSAVRLFQTSSPSYLLTASIDYARAYMEKNKKKLDLLINTVRKHSPANVLKTGNADPLKIIIKCDGLRGEKILRKNMFVPEMCGRGYIVCIVTVADEADAVCRLLSVAAGLPEKKVSADFCFTKKSGATPWEAYHHEGKPVPLAESAGKISKNAVFLYPPGVPVIAPGQIITEDVIEFIKKALSEGESLVGLCGEEIDVLK